MSTLVCRIDMDKHGGVVVEVVNDGAGRKQRISLDGTRIRMVVSGPAGESSITQDDDSVTVQCNRFVLDAGTIECRARTTADYQSGASTNIAAAAEATLRAGATLALQAGASASLQAGESCAISSGLDLSLASGAAASLTAGAEVSVAAAATVDVAAAGELTMAAASITIAAADVNIDGVTSIPGLIPPFL